MNIKSLEINILTVKRMAKENKPVYDYPTEINHDNNHNLEHLKDQLWKWVASNPSDVRTRQIAEIENEIEYLT